MSITARTVTAEIGGISLNTLVGAFECNDDVTPVTPALAKRIMLPMRKRWSFSLFVGLFVLSGLVAADHQEKKKATLVETRSEPRCYGLDCPPLPTAPNMAF